MRRCNEARLGVILGQYFLCPSNVHMKNEKLHAFRRCDIVVGQVANGDKTKKKKKYLQFVTIFHLFQQGCLMIILRISRNFSNS